MPYVVTAVEYLDIDGVPFDTPAWTTQQMDDLWSTPAVRGGDRILPGAAGVRALPRRPTVTGATVEVAVVGDLTWEGDPYDDPSAGLALNCAHLAELTLPAGTPSGTRTATLHMRTGVADRTGPVHVEQVRFARDGAYLAVAQFSLSLPMGALA